MKKILVTGANGFVGKHLLNELTSNAYEIVAVGGSQVPDLEGNKGYLNMTLDLTDPEQAKEIDFSGIDGVVHLAGLAAVGPSFDEPMKYMNVNVGIEINLFEAARAQNAHPRFLAISSATLYDPSATQPLNESSPLLPNSPYAVSKIGQEEIAKYYSTRGFETMIARPFNHIGPGQGPGFIVPDLAEQVVKVAENKSNTIMVGNLDAKRDYTDVRDIAWAYRLMLEKGRPGETYNICSGKSLSGHEILEGLCQAAGVKPEIKQDQTRLRPSDTPEIVGSFSKLEQDTGWRPEIAVDRTLRDVIESLKG